MFVSRTKGFDLGGALKDGIRDIGPLQECSKHEPSQTCSDDKDHGLVAAF